MAFQIATRIDSEIISADSRQVYRHLDIGTAKPAPTEQRSVPHHLIDLIEPDGTYSVGDFVPDAIQALEGIATRGRVALLVGGTGHYVRTLLQGNLLPGGIGPAARREQLEREVRDKGVDFAIARIEEIDPITAKRLDRRNVRRVVRALEIILGTGQPVPPLQPDPLPALVLGLTRNRSTLYEQADDRVRGQISAGLVGESERVLAMGYPPDIPVLRGLAYGQMIRHLLGELTLAEAISQYMFATHALIRRQTSWFRREPRIQWLDAADSRLAETAMRLVQHHVKG